jgi:hypothetical protein
MDFSVPPHTDPGGEAVGELADALVSLLRRFLRAERLELGGVPDGQEEHVRLRLEGGFLHSLPPELPRYRASSKDMTPAAPSVVDSPNDGPARTEARFTTFTSSDFSARSLFDACKSRDERPNVTEAEDGNNRTGARRAAAARRWNSAAPAARIRGPPAYTCQTLMQKQMATEFVYEI